MDQGIELAIFDCDGVLVDSEVIAVEVDQRILREYGWELSTEEVIDRFLGRSSAHFRSELESFLGHALPDDWEEPYLPWYFDAFENGLRSVEGIEAALDGIPHARCVASSGTPEKIRKTLGLTGLLPRFEGAIFSAVEVARGKPEPDLFLHAAARMGAEPSRCVVIEDSQHGVAAARAAGMHAYGYAGGLTPAAWLEGPGTTIFHDMTVLPTLLVGRR